MASTTTTTTKRPALGSARYMMFSGTMSNPRPECHAASTYRVSDLSGANGWEGPRGKKMHTILTYWQSIGIARYNKRAGGVWEGRDVLHGGEWLPFAGQGEEARADRVVFSHVFSSDNGGAWCACNVVPENGAANTARGSLNMSSDGTSLTPDALVALTGWGAWWAKHAARPTSLKRMGL